jgi:hypothetical protein
MQLLGVAGKSLSEAGIDDGDILAAHRAIKPRHGRGYGLAVGIEFCTDGSLHTPLLGGTFSSF